jgi:hypothetical protein
MCILENNILKFVHFAYCFVQNIRRNYLILVLKGQGEYIQRRILHGGAKILILSSSSDN